MEVLKSFMKQMYRFLKSIIKSPKNEVNAPYYRLIKQPTKDDQYLHIHVVNKGIIFKMLPEDIMRDDMLLSFSRTDIVIITHLGTKNEMKSSSSRSFKLFKILKQLFSQGKTSFMIEKEDGSVEEHVANDIYTNPDISEKLSGTDGIKVGYSVAEEHYHKIIKLKEKS